MTLSLLLGVGRRLNKSMNKIHAFGCSLTAQHSWAYLVEPEVFIPDDDWYDITEWAQGEFSVRSYAINNGSNDMQVISYGNEVHKNNIDTDDIVIWQLTGPGRYGVRKIGANSDDCRDSGVLVDENIYTGNGIRMINKPNIDTDYTNLYGILWCLNGVKRRNTKTLVVFGWDDALYKKDRVVQFLKENDIDYIEESIYEYSTRKGHPTKLSNHPMREGYKDFTQNKLLPKLKELDWLE